MKKESKLTYKQLYEIELNNRKMYEQRYKEVMEENYKLQKESGLADLRKEIIKLKEEKTKTEVNYKALEALYNEIKEDRARLYIQLEDLRNEKELEKNRESNNGE